MTGFVRESRFSGWPGRGFAKLRLKYSVKDVSIA